MNIRQKTINALIEMGANPQNKGFRYAVDAIELINENNSVLEAMTKKLYPGVASKNKTAASRVERAIRHMVEQIVTYNKLSDVEKYIQVSEKVTNGKFLSTLYYKLIGNEVVEKTKDVSVKANEVDSDTCVFCGSKLTIVNVNGKNVCEKCAKEVASQLLAF